MTEAASVPAEAAPAWNEQAETEQAEVAPAPAETKPAGNEQAARAGPTTAQKEKYHIPVFLRVNVLDIQNVGNDNRFKLKLYFECCWDVARANYIVEKLVPQEEEREKWGLLGVKNYDYNVSKIPENIKENSQELEEHRQKFPVPKWDPNVFFPNLIEVNGELSGGLNEWDQYDKKYQNEKWTWDFWKEGRNERKEERDEPPPEGYEVLGKKVTGTTDSAGKYYKEPNPPLVDKEKQLWGERRMFSRRVIATVTFKYETDLKRFPLDQQELWLYVRSRTAERLPGEKTQEKQIKVVLVQNPHVRSVMEQAAFSHSGQWHHAMSKFHWSRIKRLQISTYNDDDENASDPRQVDPDRFIVPNAMLAIIARREVDVAVRVQSVLPFFFFLTMAFGGLFIPVPSIDQRMGFFSSLSIRYRSDNCALTHYGAVATPL